MSQYVYDTGRSKMPTGLAPHPYPSTQAWDRNLLQPTSYYAPPGSATTHLGQSSWWDDETKGNTLVKVLLLAGLAFVLWQIFKGGVKSNPKGRNKVAKVWRGGKGWMYKLVRKGAKSHGPFSSEEEAVAAAENKGYGVL